MTKEPMTADARRYFVIVETPAFSLWYLCAKEAVNLASRFQQYPCVFKRGKLIENVPPTV